MNRSKFLKSIGLATGAVLASPLLAGASLKQEKHKSPAQARGGCVLVPSEGPGPFFLDLTDNTYYFRQDITEDRVGTPMLQRIRVIELENCQPMANVRVNLWCCDQDGLYSGYGDEEGLTYMRGYQITDDNGEVEFHTIFPGWYPGRVVHMHMQVHVNTNYSAVTQYTWPHDAAVEIANNAPDLYADGPDPMTPEMDFAFTDGYENQLATCDWDEDAQIYVSVLEVAVQGSGVDSVGYLESQAALVFSLHQNSPNPAHNFMEIPLQLFKAAEVQLSIWAISGKKIYTKDLGTLAEGSHNLPLNLSSLGISPGSYIYQLDVKAGGRKHHDVKRFLVI